jgi:hypothetical protein
MSEGKRQRVVGPATGRVLADLMTEAVIKARTALAPVEAAHATAAQRDQLDAWEAEVAPFLTAIRDHLTGDGALPGPLGALLDVAADPPHASILGAGIIQAVVFSFMLSALSQLGIPLFQDAVNDMWGRFQSMPLSASEVALNELRGGQFKGHGHAEAKLTGVNPDRYDALLYNTGEPPGIEQMLFLRRRGKIDDAQLDRAIRQSRIRDEWIPAVHDLMLGPASAQEAIAAAVQGHLTPEQSQAVVAENGIDPSNWLWLFETAGRPPGTEQMLHLLNRGVVDQAAVEQSIRESNVKDKYVPALLALRRQLMPQRTIVSAVSKGALTADQAIVKLREVGYNDEDARILASEATKTKAAKHHDLAVAQVDAAYEAGLISHGDAHARLLLLNYSDADADLALALADHKAVAAAQAAEVGRVRSRFLAHHVDESTALNLLDAIGVAPAKRDAALQLWTIERGAVTRTLTEAQMVKAVKARAMTVADFRERLAAMGYNATDADILVKSNGLA